ncbi:FxSxx-COOH system tetratricopeptide repeat protein [Nocardia sp. NPDC005978]|uniref:FxSxx-COOH system tetratricopeptide repeat protein n=1 Tax=Nocardia sp. NPDC005978 TaxID=3156725 RepID=UPI00339DCED0
MVSGAEESEQARFAAEIAALRSRSRLSAQEISTWIKNQKHTTVAESTISDWLKPQPAIPRTNKTFLLVVECLHRDVGLPWDRTAQAHWKRQRAQAYAERLPVNQPASTGKVQSSPDESAGTTGVPAKVVGLVPREPPHFVFRNQLVALSSGLARSREATIVTGMRGTGKTQLAAAYARHVLDTEKGVLVGWVNAESAGTLHTGLAEIADTLGLTAADGNPVTSAHRLRDHLNNHLDPHLLVLDNATDPDLLRTVLPTRGGTRVVITTTKQAMTRLGDCPAVEIGGYNSSEANEFLRAATGIIDDPTGETELSEELGHLPLALAAAAAAITTARPRLAYADYLHRLRSQPLPRALRRHAGTDHPLRADQAISLSITAAEATSDDSDLDTVVVWLLDLFALLAPTGVRRDLLRHSSPTFDELVDDAIDRCAEHSLLSWSAHGDRLLAHRLTARVLLERARDTGNSDRLLSQVFELLSSRLFDDEQAWARRGEGADLVDQIETIWASALPTHARDDLRNYAMVLRFWATRHLLKAANPDRAVPIAEDAVTVAEQFHGLDDPNTLAFRDNLARAYASAGRLDDAIHLHQRTLNDREQILGLDHLNTLDSRNHLATAYESTGRLVEAIKLYERNLTSCQQILEPGHCYILTARNNLANAYGSAGRFDEAIRLHERTLADREQISGLEHPDTLLSQGNLAHVYEMAGRFDEAIHLYTRTLASREQALAIDHPDTLMVRNNLASVYESAGRFEEAIHLYERTFTDRERILGPNHLDTILSRGNLASAYESVGRFDEAIPLHERTLADRERILGDYHPTTLIARGNVAGVYESVGRSDDAINIYERTLTDFERIMGRRHVNTLTTCNNLANAYRSAGRLEPAIALYERTLNDMEEVLGLDHPTNLTVRGSLARAVESAGRLPEAIALYEHNLTDAERILGSDHRDTLKARNDLANAYSSVGQLDQAIPLHERTVADYRRVLGPAHPETLTSSNNLARTYELAGRIAEAIVTHQRTLMDIGVTLSAQHASLKPETI